MLPGQLPPAQLVVHRHVACRPPRDLLVDYLTERAAELDYASLDGLASNVVGLFWRDLKKHHPGIESLRLAPEVAAAWKDRVRMIWDKAGRPLRPRVNIHSGFAHVRAFYQDQARWATENPARRIQQGGSFAEQSRDGSAHPHPAANAACSGGHGRTPAPASPAAAHRRSRRPTRRRLHHLNRTAETTHHPIQVNAAPTGAAWGLQQLPGRTSEQHPRCPAPPLGLGPHTIAPGPPQEARSDDRGGRQRSLRPSEAAHRPRHAQAWRQAGALQIACRGV